MKIIQSELSLYFMPSRLHRAPETGEVAKLVVAVFNPI